MILERIVDPKDIRKLNEVETLRLCDELRAFLLAQVSKTGGHLASNLGVVELTVAITAFLIRPTTDWCLMWVISAMSTRL